MKALIDTSVWFRRYHGLPMKRSLRRFLQEEVSEFHLCPLSVAEICFKWKRGRLPGVPDPEHWVDRSLENYVLELPGAAVSKKAGSWPWPHGDLVDRVLAAIAAESDLVLVHTDRVLESLGGFPQRYFPNASM
ncbi:MAG TPA: PIN domain-containing protein [Thermoanaerobaculia bacterium]|nr:PIN domain-containing protein [Thermoanaerobaculia bacterium]